MSKKTPAVSKKQAEAKKPTASKKRAETKKQAASKKPTADKKSGVVRKPVTGKKIPQKKALLEQADTGPQKPIKKIRATKLGTPAPADKPTSKTRSTTAARTKKPASLPAKRAAAAVPAPVAQDTDIDPAARERGDIPMSLISHLDEFRSRFLVSLLTVFILMLASFVFSDYILAFLNKPYLETGLKLNVFNLIEGFLLRLKSSLLAGILLGFPVIVYQLWKYISPAISVGDRMFARFSVVASLFLFYSGMTLTYLALPFAIKALLSFTPDDMTSLINAGQYLNFVMLFCLAIGAVFELPIVIMILTKIGIVTPSFLISKRKYAIVLIWILAAVITPTVDPLTQSLVALPLMLLYEISIFISKMMVKRKKRKEMETSQ